MTSIITRLTAAALGLAVLLAGAASAETPVGSSVENRLMLAYKANDAAVQAMMPDGWKALTLPQGPLAGTNLLLSFIDRDLVLDADGKPAEPHQERAMAVLAYGVSPNVQGARLFITRVFERAPLANTYGNSVEADFMHEVSVKTQSVGAPSHVERWVVMSGGGTLDLTLSYDRGTPGWSEKEVRPYSAANPDFFRIYRYEQLADLAMSNGLGKPLSGEVALTSDIGELAEALDGSHELQAILVIPSYVRTISLP